MQGKTIHKFEAKTDDYNKKVKGAQNGLKQLGLEGKKTGQIIDQLDKSFGTSFSSLGKMAIGVAAATKGFDLMCEAIKGNIETAKNFEKSLSGLSSLTGVTGKELEKYKEYAIELGGSSTQTASQVVEAFKLIGSQKPELLKSSEALKDVTKNAITLAEAAGMEVPDAAKALTASLNIMGASANQADRYINVLAAGSKEGSADIQALTEIIFKSGQAAKMNGLSFEKFIAVAETIAPSFGSAQEAGTALNAMLLKLETQSNSKFKPSVVGLYEALNNLKEANLSAKDSTKLVTETGYKALVPILENIDAIQDLETRITGTSTAIDQARINTNNLDGALNGLSSAWERLNLTVNSSCELLTGYVNEGTDVINTISDIVKELKGVKSESEESDISFSNFIKTTVESVPGLKEATAGYQIFRAELGMIRDYLQDIPVEKLAAIGQVGMMSGATIGGVSGIKSSSGTESVYDDTTEKGIKEHIKALKELREEVTLGGSAYMSYTQQIANLEAKLKSFSANKAINKKAGSLMFANSYGEAKKKNVLGKEKVKQPTSKFDSTIIPKIEDPEWIKNKVHGGIVNDLYAQFDAEEQAEKIKKLESAWAGVGSSISAVSSALQGMEDPTAKVLGIVAEAIANIALTFAKSLKGTFTPWDWIAGAAAGTATMISTIAAIKSATEYHADGGMVGLNSLKRGSDVVPAMLTPGEIVLNKAQQSNLAGQLRQNSISNLNLTTRLRSEDIEICLNSRSQRRGKGEYVTSRG